MAARFALSATTLLLPSGKINAGGKINFYISGTTTDLATFATSSLISSNVSPLILDEDGRVPEAWANDADEYSIQILDSSDNVVVPTFDNVSFIAAFSLSSADVLSALASNSAAVVMNGSQLTGSAYANFADNFDLTAAGSIDASAGAINLGTVTGATVFSTVTITSLTVDGNTVTTDDNSDSNTRIGVEAGNALTSSSTGNTLYGNAAGKILAGAGDISNSFFGTNSGLLANGSASGANNAFGNASLAAMTTGFFNTAMASGSLSSLTTGSFNAALGGNTLSDVTTGIENIGLGTRITAGSSTAIGRIMIGGLNLAGTSDTRIHIGNGTNHIYNDYNSSNTWTFTSDENAKDFIQDSRLGLDFINALQPKEYTWKPVDQWPEEWGKKGMQDMDTRVNHGVSAQSVKAAMDAEGVETFAGWGQLPNGMQTVGESALVFPLINAVNELTELVKSLKADIELLKG